MKNKSFVQNIKKSALQAISVLFLLISILSFSACYPPKPKGTTYYVSADGTATIKTQSIDNPMSLRAAVAFLDYSNNDEILLKRGDTFYVSSLVFATRNITSGNHLKISSYGDESEPIPVISGARIINSATVWEPDEEGIFKIDMSNPSNFSGLTNAKNEASGYGYGFSLEGAAQNVCNVGFLEDVNGNKYYNRKPTKEELTEEFDFYCDGTDLYIKSTENPYTILGELKAATRLTLLILRTNTIVDGLHLRYTGGHGITNYKTTENVIIRNCLIEDIGGSYLNQNSSSGRYGNGIEFWLDSSATGEKCVRNMLVEKNIIRNVYDAGFTMQGTDGFWQDVTLRKNILISNTYSVELWSHGTESAGILNFSSQNNLHINQGDGWGYDARHNTYPAAEFVFWGGNIASHYEFNVQNNTYFNPRRIFFAYRHTAVPDPNESKYFSDSTYNNNTLYITDECILLGVWDEWFQDEGDIVGYQNFPQMQEELEIEQNSTAIHLTQEDIETKYASMLSIAALSNDYNQITEEFNNAEEEE